MAGLLDIYDDPNQAGLLGLATGLLSAGGPSRTPIGFGQALAVGLQGMQTNRKATLDQQKEDLQMKMLQQQIAMATTKAARDEGLQKMLLGRLTGSGAQTTSVVPGMASAMPGGEMSPKVGGPDWLQSYQEQNPQVTKPQVVQSGGQQPGAFPFSLNEVAAIHALGGPNLTDAFKLATDPTKMEGGSVYKDRATGQERYIPKIGEGMQLGPNGVSLAPGYLNSMGAIKGAETAAVESTKANYDLLPLGYVGQDGRPIGGTRGAYVNSFNQPAAPQIPQGGPGGREGLDLTRLTPQQQAFLRKRDPEAFSNGVERFTGSAPILQSEAEKQVQLGAITGRQNTQQDLNKNWITASYNPVIDAGRSASTMTASLDALKNIDLKTGWGTESRAHAANVLTSLGIGSDNAKLFSANAQKFQSIAMDRLMTVLQAQKGPQTEGDAQRAQQTWVQLQNTPEANQFIADFARAKANTDARRARFYQEALPLAQQSGDLNEIDRRWAKIQGSIWSDPVLQRYIKGK